MPLVVADTLQVTILGDGGDGPFANVLHVQMDSGMGSYLQALAVLDAYVEDVLPELCSSVTVSHAAYMELDSLSGLTGTVSPTPGPDLDGGVTAPPAPPQVAYVIKLGGPTERGVRNGRMYLPGVRGDEVSSAGDISDVTIASMNTACNTFVSDVLANAGGPLVIVHAPAGGPTSSSEVLGAQCEKPVGTQRRRLKR